MLDSATIRMSPEIWERKLKPFSIPFPSLKKYIHKVKPHSDIIFGFLRQTVCVVLLHSALTVGQKRLDNVAVRSAAELATVLWNPSMLTNFSESRKRRTPRTLRIHCKQRKEESVHQSPELLTLIPYPAVLSICDCGKLEVSVMLIVFVDHLSDASIHLFSVSHLFPGSQGADVNVSLSIVCSQQLRRLCGKTRASDVVNVVDQGRC